MHPALPGARTFRDVLRGVALRREGHAVALFTKGNFEANSPCSCTVGPMFLQTPDIKKGEPEGPPFTAHHQK